jgi:flagellar hook-basal body complex protein FliE
MSIQFQSRFLLEDDEHRGLKDMFQELGASEEAIEMFIHAIEMKLLTPATAVEIIKSTTNVNEDGMGGGSTTGGGVTNGASFAPGNGEQYAMGTKKVRKSLGEDAPMLAGGKKANISTYTNDGFTKAPSAEAAGKKIKGVEVKELWEEEPLKENYYSFRTETKTRGKSDQFHEAVKIINKKLDEVNRLLEFTGTLKSELSEGEDNFEVKTNTKKAMNKVRGKVIEAYQKLKEL